jgi:hypothetical protein
MLLRLGLQISQSKQTTTADDHSSEVGDSDGGGGSGGSEAVAGGADVVANARTDADAGATALVLTPLQELLAERSVHKWSDVKQILMADDVGWK